MTTTTTAASMSVGGSPAAAPSSEKLEKYADGPEPSGSTLPSSSAFRGTAQFETGTRDDDASVATTTASLESNSSSIIARKLMTLNRCMFQTDPALDALLRFK